MTDLTSLLTSCFQTTVEITLAVSILVLALLLLSPIIGRQYTAKWRYWAWLLLAVRLIIPFNLSLPKAPVQLPEPSGGFSIPVPPVAPSVPVPTPMLPDTSLPPAEAAPVVIPWLLIAACVWLLGAVVFLCWQLGGALLFRRELRRWGRSCESGKAAELFSRLREEMGLRRVRLMICPRIPSPMVTGLFRPLLLLPKEDYAPEDLAWILRHELVHCRRRDILYKLLLLLANALHWFNPLVWLMAREANRDVEISCDEEVLRGADSGQRGRYGDVIMSLVHSGRQRGAAFSTYFAGGKHSIKQRFDSIFDTRAKRGGALALAILLLTAAVAGGLFAWKSSRPGGESLVFPHSMGISTATLYDGSTAEVELLMTSGTLYRAGDPDLIPGGGLWENADNYVGTFELVLRVNGQETARLPYHEERDSNDIFHGPVQLQFYDYNGNHHPEFTLGTWRWSGGNSYSVYELSPGDEPLLLLAEEIPNDTMDASVLFDHPQEGMFLTHCYNNAIGKTIHTRYVPQGVGYAPYDQDLPEGVLQVIRTQLSSSANPLVVNLSEGEFFDRAVDLLSRAEAYSGPATQQEGDLIYSLRSRELGAWVISLANTGDGSFTLVTNDYGESYTAPAEDFRVLEAMELAETAPVSYPETPEDDETATVSMITVVKSSSSGTYEESRITDPDLIRSTQQVLEGRKPLPSDAQIPTPNPGGDGYHFTSDTLGYWVLGSATLASGERVTLLTDTNRTNYYVAADAFSDLLAYAQSHVYQETADDIAARKAAVAKVSREYLTAQAQTLAGYRSVNFQSIDVEFYLHNGARVTAKYTVTLDAGETGMTADLLVAEDISGNWKVDKLNAEITADAA